MNYRNELLILYNSKDEEIFKHIQSLIVSKDDTSDNVVGVKDGSVLVYKSLFPDYDRFKHSADKFLFIDCIPSNSIKNQLFRKYGVSYGTIDKDHMYIEIDSSFNWDRQTYDIFLRELNMFTNLPVSEVDALAKKEKTLSPLKMALYIASIGIVPPLGISLLVINADNEKEANELFRKQLLYYGITKMYFDDMNSILND